MLSNFPRASTLRTVGSSLTQLPAAALAVRTDPNVDLADPNALLERVTIALLTWHPAVLALVEAAGGRAETRTTLTVPVEGAAARPAALSALVARLAPGAWGQYSDSIEAALGVRPAQGAGKPAQVTIVVSRTGRRATLKLAYDGPLVAAGRPLRAGAPVRLRPAELVDLMGAARRAGLVVTDADTRGRLSDTGWLVDRRLILAPAVSAPGWASRDSGELVTSNVPDHAPVAVAVPAARSVRGQVAVAVDDHVADVAALAAAGPADVPGLRPWQQEFVGKYLATTSGLVNALPPGIGKSACAAGAMAAQVNSGNRRHRGIVVAGASLLTQWVGELTKFHPAATVVLASSEADVTKARREWKKDKPTVLVATPEFVAGHVEDLSTFEVDDLVVDEATFLRSDSDRTRALWQLRAGAGRAVALTGTPDNGGDRTLESLVAFTRARRDLFTGPSPVTASLLERCGPLVFTAPASVVTSVPAFTPEVVALELGAAERAVQVAAVARVKDILAAVKTPAQERRAAAKIKSELDAWRLGLANPAALAASKYGLAAALEGADLTSGKVTWAVEWVSRIAAQGRSTLVFADSVPALEDTVAALKAAGVSAAALSSKVRPAARPALVEAFQAGDVSVLAITATGQLGLNLQAASAVVHLDVPTSGPMFTQRTARAARMGSTHERIDVAVPLLASSAEVTWWAHASGARAGTDLVSLARELTA